MTNKPRVFSEKLVAFDGGHESCGKNLGQNNCIGEVNHFCELVVVEKIVVLRRDDSVQLQCTRKHICDSNF